MALLLTVSIFILLCTTGTTTARIVNQPPKKINITENFNSDVEIIFLQDDALNSTIYTHMNSSQDNFKYQISTFQYYRHKRNLLYKSILNFVTNKAYLIHNDICYYDDLDSDSEIFDIIDGFLDLPGIYGVLLVVAFNIADEYKWIKSHDKCPFSEIPCEEWHLNTDFLYKFGFKNKKVDDYDLIAYVTKDGMPVIFAPNYKNITECTEKDCIIAVYYKNFHPGLQTQDKFLPPEPAKCKKSPI